MELASYNGAYNPEYDRLFCHHRVDETRIAPVFTIRTLPGNNLVGFKRKFRTEVIRTGY